MLEPITRVEQFLASAAGQGVSLPIPQTRMELFLQDICERLDGIGEPSAEDIQTAVNAYLDEHPATGRAATMEEFLEVLNHAE